MQDAISAMSTVFRKFALTEVANIPRARARTDHAMLHVMGSAAKTLGVMCSKVYSTAGGKARFLVNLYDGKTGALLAIISADLLGAIRTGATSALATKLMANPEANKVGMFGCGWQARTQLEGLSQVRSIEALVIARDQQRLATFCSEMSQKLGISVTPAESVEQLISQSNIMVTATSANSPLFDGKLIKPGTHLNVIGSNYVGRQEVDGPLVARSRVVVEDKEQARLEAGDLIEPIDKGLLKWSHVMELAQVVVGQVNPRQSPDDITMFKSIGSAMEDLAVAKIVYDRAIQQNRGVELPIDWN